MMKDKTRKSFGTIAVIAIAFLDCFVFVKDLRAQTPDGQTPAEETVCDILSGKAWGLCVAYCEAQDCDLFPDHPSCDVLRQNSTRLTGSDKFPCEGPRPE